MSVFAYNVPLTHMRCPLVAEICLTDKKKNFVKERGPRNLRGVVGKLIALYIRDREFDHRLLQPFGRDLKGS